MSRATALSLILLAFAASLVALAAPAAAKTKPCWKQVVDDWTQDQVIDGTYPSRCIDEALEKVPEDIRAYSDFEEQAEAARQGRSRDLYGSGGGDPANPPSGDVPVQEREPDAGPKDESPVSWALGNGGNNADSVPIPLLILLALAGVLITAGGAGFAARKLKARRGRP